MSNYIQAFKDQGGQFFCSQEDFNSKAKGIKAILFDWDGVFNDGIKIPEHGSLFAEPSSMGLNMLRFAFWKLRNEIPITAILTGAVNPRAEHFAERDKLHCIFHNFKDKGKAFDAFLKQYNLKPSEVCYVFDDILDLAPAHLAGLRIQAKRLGSPALDQYIVNNKLVDYKTYCTGGQGASRETCELLISSLGLYDWVVEERVAYSETFKKYISERQSIKLTIHKP